MPRRKGQAPEEVLVAFSDSPKGYRGVPYLAVVVTRAHLHARVGVRGESARRAAMQRALAREAVNLAKKGKPFRKLRQYQRLELRGAARARRGALGRVLAGAGRRSSRRARRGSTSGWPGRSRRRGSLSVGDLLGVFRDLSPLYKVLANAT